MSVAVQPLEAFEQYYDRTHLIPDVMEFIASDRYLDRANLYPRQATILKTIFLQEDQFTQYDYDVLGEWAESYLHTADEKGEGNNGIVPDVLDRIRINRLCSCDHDMSYHSGLVTTDRYGTVGRSCITEGCDCAGYDGRRWFREVISALGRRGSKGHVGALAGSYILWHYIEKGDPQRYYGVDRDKRLTAIVFAGKKEQAKANQWRDINNVILGAPCFMPYISRPQAESLTIYSKRDLGRLGKRRRMGIRTDQQDSASFEIVPRESTTIAGRGIAGFMQFYDEAAHVVKGVANVPAEFVYEAAAPALDQFKKDGWIYLPSSPWQRIGLFYDKYSQAREVDEETGDPIYPEMLMIQLTSWNPYEDWEKAHQIQRTPNGLYFIRLHNAIQAYDQQMEKLERANPETFKVERRSHFAAVMDAYLNPERIADMWKPWPGEEDVLTQKVKGEISKTYRAHGDPSKSGANFGFAIAHVEDHDDRGLPHVVFDVIHNWNPADFDRHEVDYDQIGGELEDYIANFLPKEMSFDQFNSVSTIQRLQKFVRRRHFPKSVDIYERPATGPLNWKTWETFKTALGLGLIHAPNHELADQELTFLQDLGGKVEHPTSGPIQTKDVADCLAIVTYELIGNEMSTFIGQALGDLSLHASAQGGMPGIGAREEEVHSQLSSFGRGRDDRSLRRPGRPRR